jgi:hypothetical protein
MATSALTAFAVTTSNGKAKPSENSAPLATERAERNSAGGDREKGGFGPAQAEAAQTEGSYGQGLVAGGFTGKP